MTTDNNQKKTASDAKNYNTAANSNTENQAYSDETKTEPNIGDTVTVKKKPSVRTDIFDIIIFFLTTGTVYAAFYIFFNLADGYLISITHFIFTAVITALLVIKEKRFPKKAVFPAVLLVIITASYSLFQFNSVIRHIFSLYLFACFISALTDTYGFPLKTTTDVFRQIRSLFLIPVIKIFLPYKSLSVNKNKPNFKKITGILIGFVLGIPVFLVCAILLISGDTAFQDVFFEIFGGLIDWALDIIDNIFVHIECGIVTLLFAPFLYSFIYSSRHKLSRTETEDDSIEKKIKKLEFINSSVLLGFYSVISICYIIFLFSQLKYLFSAFSDAPDYGYSLSEYARNGFFEMSAVAIINLGLIAAGVLFAKRNEKKELPKTYKIFSVFFCMFTILLIVIAIMKMAHYVTGLGLTQKRLAVLLADIVMLIAFICILIKLFRKNFPYLKIASSVALIAICLFLTAGTDALIADFNTEMYLSGKHREIDIYTISELSSDYRKIINLDKLVNDKDEKVANTAKNRIYFLYSKYTYASEKSDTLDEKLFKDYCKKNTERFISYRKYTDYYAEERQIETKLNYSQGRINIVISVPDTFVKLELSNSLASAVISYDDKTAFEDGEYIGVYEWIYPKEQGLLATLIATDIDGNCYEFDIRLDGEISTENETKTVQALSDWFEGELICDDTGNYQIINTEY